MQISLGSELRSLMTVETLKAMLIRENELRYSDALQEQYKAAELREDIDWMQVNI